MKKILLSLTFITAIATCSAQSINLNISPYVVTDTAKTIFIRIMDNTDSTATFYYELKNGAKIVEFRNIIIPIAAGQEIFKYPIDLNGINHWLSAWGIVATGKCED